MESNHLSLSERLNSNIRTSLFQTRIELVSRTTCLFVSPSRHCHTAFHATIKINYLKILVSSFIFSPIENAKHILLYKYPSRITGKKTTIQIAPNKYSCVVIRYLALCNSFLLLLIRFRFCCTYYFSK